MRIAAMSLLLALVVASHASAQDLIFRFEADGVWLNLHHFLYVLGRAEARMPDMARRAVVNAPADQTAGMALLNAQEKKAWQEAVSGYAAGLSRKDAVFDKEVYSVTGALAALRPTDSLGRAQGLDPATRAILEKAGPIYRKAWWPRHQKSNNDYVHALFPLIEKHGDAIVRYITRAYQEAWPKGGYPVNISAYTNWAGAYSTAGNLLVVASTDEGNQGVLGLESVFHESMHQWDDAMFRKLAAVAKQQGGGKVPGDMTHTMIFYTAGEAVRSVVPSHKTYAEQNDMWKRGNHPQNKPLLDASWKPYLDGKGTLNEALAGLIIRP